MVRIGSWSRLFSAAITRKGIGLTAVPDIFRTGDDSKTGAHPDFNISSTSSYLDLSPLYGNNVEEQEAVRTMKGGMLKPDTFSDVRILGFPPGVSALLIAFSRFHNYVAEQLKRINEGGRFGLDPRLSQEEAERKVDKDLFNTARLYVSHILRDRNTYARRLSKHWVAFLTCSLESHAACMLTSSSRTTFGPSSI